MAKNVIMKGKDTVSAKLAECFITIEGNRYNFMQAINFEAVFTKNKTQVPILGNPGMGHKATGWDGTWKATLHYNQSVMRELMLKYKDTGEDVYFEIQVSNDDPTSAAGRQSAIFVDCNLDSAIIAKFDADGSYLDEELAGTYEDFLLPEKFTTLEGFAA